ncbi:hypothetical protein POM88_042715 [Heracleum sosnowskyi]|uniref:Uncharacterized protein n=1 Tax=Heracleum sosnowskyi TaxID=360622 RepID=A0AAD8HIZ8_9APIA|nr:hypothetical protein POM88_042715 [Heracleum sosnowskyi]
MHNPVSVLVVVLIGLAGAALGYWLVRKFVISEDGSVDVGVASFVKWAMRIVGFTCVFQSTLDTYLALTAQGITLEPTRGRATAKHTRAEFLSRQGTTNRDRNLWNSPNSPRSSAKWIDSPVKGLVSPPSTKTKNQQEFYSTFHKTPDRKKFSKQEWEDCTEESTRQALADWASSPEFTDWLVKNADRVKVLPDESSDESLAAIVESVELGETLAEVASQVIEKVEESDNKVTETGPSIKLDESLSSMVNQVSDSILARETENMVAEAVQVVDLAGPTDCSSEVVNKVHDTVQNGETRNGDAENFPVVESEKDSLVEETGEVIESPITENHNRGVMLSSSDQRSPEFVEENGCSQC